MWVPLGVALLLAMLTAASYAELATKYPRAGGASHYATRAFGPFAGFVAGFCMLAAGIVSVAALARGFGGDYLSAFVTLPVGLVAVVFLAVLALVNARGIKESTRANVVATVVEVGGLLVIVALGGWLLLRGDGDVGRLGQLGTPEKGAAAAVLSGSVLAYYSFVGFETSVNVAEETRDPRRSYPRALFGALATAGAVYVLVGLAASVAVPTARLAESSGPLLEVVEEAGGVPPRVFSAIALVAVANGALLTGIMSSRLAYGMARDGLLPAALTRVLPGRRTPWAAIALTTLLSMLLALTGSVATLASTLVLLLLVVFLMVNTAVLVLRRDPGEAGHFRAPTVLPVLGAASCVASPRRSRPRCGCAVSWWWPSGWCSPRSPPSGVPEGRGRTAATRRRVGAATERAARPAWSTGPGARRAMTFTTSSATEHRWARERCDAGPGPRARRWSGHSDTGGRRRADRRDRPRTPR